jgi:hypothetical protein
LRGLTVPSPGAVIAARESALYAYPRSLPCVLIDVTGAIRKEFGNYLVDRVLTSGKIATYYLYADDARSAPAKSNPGTTNVLDMRQRPRLGRRLKLAAPSGRITWVNSVSAMAVKQ